MRPLFCETGLRDTPYFVAGSAVLLGLGRDVFAITAKHVVGSYGLGKLLMFPADSSRTPLRFIDSTSPAPLTGEDFEDLVALRARVDSIPPADRRNGRVLDLNKSDDLWPGCRYTCTYRVLGFPLVSQDIDYELRVLSTQQVQLSASYIGPSALPHCHEIEVEAAVVESFSGFSGGPVFSVLRQLGMKPRVQFCGITLRGSASSKRVHFLDREVVLEVLRPPNYRPLSPDGT